MGDKRKRKGSHREKGYRPLMVMMRMVLLRVLCPKLSERKRGEIEMGKSLKPQSRHATNQENAVA